MKSTSSILPCIAACFIDEAEEIKDLRVFWKQYFLETPFCKHPNCLEVAYVVDPFFPYLDDRNRCGKHTNHAELTELVGMLH